MAAWAEERSFETHSIDLFNNLILYFLSLLVENLIIYQRYIKCDGKKIIRLNDEIKQKVSLKYTFFAKYKIFKSVRFYYYSQYTYNPFIFLCKD